MPYEWVEPELFVDYMGVQIYHVYKNDSPMSYWYTVDSGDCDCESDRGHQFDVRRVHQELLARDIPHDHTCHKSIIETAIAVWRKHEDHSPSILLEDKVGPSSTSQGPVPGHLVQATTSLC